MAATITIFTDRVEVRTELEDLDRSFFSIENIIAEEEQDDKAFLVAMILQNKITQLMSKDKNKLQEMYLNSLNK